MWYDECSGCPRMTFQEAHERGYISESDLGFLNKFKPGGLFVLSSECIQDMELYFRSLFQIRTGAITDEEIADWKAATKQLDKMDWDAARKKVRFYNTYLEDGKIVEEEHNPKPYDTDDWYGPLDWTERM